MSNEGDMLATG